ncbi:hypothetical protein Pfo_031341 [Paulownia fortunei]|nr:hypothetical protein Pfo_031341 [Paulownia fortunei]
MGVHIKTTSGPAIEKPGDLVALLNELEPGDILFIDEIHRMPTNIEEMMYSAMEDYFVDIMVGQGPTARAVHFPLPPFTLIGATTRPGMLSKPLRDRFGIINALQFYTPEELQHIVVRTADILHAPVKQKELMKLPCGHADTPNCQSLIKTDTMIAYYHGGPVGLNTIAANIGEEAETLESMVEPYLLQIGFFATYPAWTGGDAGSLRTSWRTLSRGTIMNFIISDTHFNHEKILYFDKSRADALRNLDIEPTVSNMDQYLENQWNDTVNDDDVVYFLGDLGMFRKKQDFVAQLARLKGQKVFFKGNHDHSDQLKAALKAPETKLIEVVDTAKAIKINGIQQYPFGQPLSFDKLWLELKKRLEMIEQSYAIESENKRFDRQVERAFDEVITINKPTPTQRHELALLVEYLNKNHLTYADVLERFDIPNVNKQLSLDEKMAVSQTGYEF